MLVFDRAAFSHHLAIDCNGVQEGASSITHLAANFNTGLGSLLLRDEIAMTKAFLGLPLSTRHTHSVGDVCFSHTGFLLLPVSFSVLLLKYADSLPVLRNVMLLSLFLIMRAAFRFHDT